MFYEALLMTYRNFEVKNDLEILLEHLQSEVDYLQKSMDECIADNDFDGAKAFLTPLRSTSKKLNTLKCIENPNSVKISNMILTIPKLEEHLGKLNFNDDNSTNEREQRRNEHFKANILNRIEKSKAELEHLQSIIPESRIDNDHILSIIERLAKTDLDKVQLEIIENCFYLNLNSEGLQVKMELRVIDESDISNYLHKYAHSILRKLGFNTETYSKEISVTKESDRIRILEEISILIYEVFRLEEGKEMNIIIR